MKTLLVKLFATIFIILFVASCSNFKQEKFQNVDKSLAKLNVSIGKGIDYGDFSLLVKDLGVELNLLNKKDFSKTELQYFEICFIIYDIYSDVHSLWAESFKLSRVYGSDSWYYIGENSLILNVLSKHDLKPDYRFENGVQKYIIDINSVLNSIMTRTSTYYLKLEQIKT